MKVALISACLSIENVPRRYEDQVMPPGYSLDVFRITDIEMPPRASMSPRLQAKIPKMLGWDMIPGYDIYVWVDASFEIPRPDSVSWLINNLEKYNFAFFKHPQRLTVGEEIGYITNEMNNGNKYLCSRYNGEDYNPKWEIKDPLFACGVFAYRFGLDYGDRARDMFRKWFYECSRYNVNDQLSLSFCLSNASLPSFRINVISENILHNKYFKHCRHK